ncbi:hypothetical protein [Enterococcus faecium]|uniref:hypothetical protein n=1 Tax=Enterococcus faecium TaxID=1352 RepID=UPI0009BD463B|nr:hypothetical protein [Enterococcus faecium]EME8099623.1 hypothetical protein [Enterococcus faecium]OQO64489.1 hypothetical protein BH743_12100 [Enterococcus faecium]
MTENKKINDIDYCFISWQLLTDLEKNSYSRNDRIRLFQEKSNARKSVIISALAIILPVLLWGFLLFPLNKSKEMLDEGAESMQNIGTRFVALFIVSAFLFLIVYMLLKNIWDSQWFRPLKNLAEKDIKVAMMNDIEIIDKKAINIIGNKVFVQPRVPEEFLSAELMLALIRYFETGQASFIKEAIYFLKLEIQNTGYYANTAQKETLLEKEKNYLSDRKSNLEKKIELSGIS